MKHLVALLVVVFAAACATPGPRYEPPTDEVVAFSAMPLAFGRDMPAATTTGRYTAPASTFNCDGTAKRIEIAGGVTRYQSVLVWNADCVLGVCTKSAEPVFLGGRYAGDGTVADALTVETGIPICNTDGCIGEWAQYDVANLQCITDGTEVDVTIQLVP